MRKKGIINKAAVAALSLILGISGIGSIIPAFDTNAASVRGRGRPATLRFRSRPVRRGGASISRFRIQEKDPCSNLRHQSELHHRLLHSSKARSRISNSVKYKTEGMDDRVSRPKGFNKKIK